MNAKILFPSVVSFVVAVLVSFAASGCGGGADSTANGGAVVPSSSPSDNNRALDRLDHGGSRR